jgi:hypothetical protein
MYLHWRPGGLRRRILARREESLMNNQARAQAQAAVLRWRQGVDAVCADLTRALGVAVGQLPAPPSDAELMRDYHVDDERDLVEIDKFKLTWSEIGAALEAVRIPDLMELKDAAADAGVAVFGGTPDSPATGDNDRDAFRHAYWNGLLVQEFSEYTAERVATAHETVPDDTVGAVQAARAEAMDLHNNQVGREIARSLGPDATPEELRIAVEQAVRDGKMVKFNADKSQLVPTDGQPQ